MRNVKQACFHFAVHPSLDRNTRTHLAHFRTFRVGSLCRGLDSVARVCEWGEIDIYFEKISDTQCSHTCAVWTSLLVRSNTAPP